MTSYSRCFHAGAKNSKTVSRGTVNLILRAHECGDAYGLPLSFLNASGIDDYGILRTNEARLVNGQLIHSSRAEVEAGSGQEIATLAGRLDMLDLCIHICVNAGDERIYNTVKLAVAGMTTAKETREFKCTFCDTDHELYMEKLAGDWTRIVLKVWRNYGRRHGNMPSNEQLFHRDPALQLDADAVLQRDLRTVFESGMRPTQSIESFS